MGVTFPLLMRGYQASLAYGAQKNYIYLVDKNGVVQDIEMLPATTVTYAQIDAAVKSIADKIPGLLNASVCHWKSSSASFPISALTGGIRLYDVRGRMISAGQRTVACQQIFKRNAAVENHTGKDLLIGR
jgi:hypothetical protein